MWKLSTALHRHFSALSARIEISTFLNQPKWSLFSDCITYALVIPLYPIIRRHLPMWLSYSGAENKVSVIWFVHIRLSSLTFEARAVHGTQLVIVLDECMGYLCSGAPREGEVLL